VLTGTWRGFKIGEGELLTGGAAQHSVGRRGQTAFKSISTDSNDLKTVQILTDPKKDLPQLEQFEQKYGFKVFEEINNFLHRSFFKFKVDF
jgi:hypothetical protein